MNKVLLITQSFLKSNFKSRTQSTKLLYRVYTGCRNKNDIYLCAFTNFHKINVQTGRFYFRGGSFTSIRSNLQPLISTHLSTKFLNLKAGYQAVPLLKDLLITFSTIPTLSTFIYFRNFKFNSLKTDKGHAIFKF